MVLISCDVRTLSWKWSIGTRPRKCAQPGQGPDNPGHAVLRTLPNLSTVLPSRHDDHQECSRSTCEVHKDNRTFDVGPGTLGRLELRFARARVLLRCRASPRPHRIWHFSPRVLLRCRASPRPHRNWRFSPSRRRHLPALISSCDVTSPRPHKDMGFRWRRSMRRTWRQSKSCSGAH